MVRKSLLGLLGLAVLAGLGGYLLYSEPSVAAVAAPERWLPELQGRTDAIGAVEILQPGQPLVRLERKPQGWVVPAMVDYPVASAPLDKLLRALAGAQKGAPLTQDAQLLGRLKLAEEGDPARQATRVNLELAGGRPLQLLIGNPGDGQLQVVRLAGDNQSWRVDRRIEVPKTELEWLDRRIVAIPSLQVSTLEMLHADGERLELYRDDASQTTFKVRQAGKRPMPMANDMVWLFANLQFADAAPLAQIGFKGKPVLNIRLRDFAGGELLAAVHLQGEQYWLTLEKTSGMDAQRLPGKLAWAYRLEPYQYRILAKKRIDLLAGN
jgi:hypothetical protein